ncbi:MAG: four helix bundle protein [Pseudomonadota bacterium]
MEENSPKQQTRQDGFVLKIQGKKIENVEELSIYKMARKLANSIYSMTRRATFVKDEVLITRGRDTALSLLGDLVNGFDQGSKDNFIDLLWKIKGYCGQLKAFFALALDQRYIDDALYEEVVVNCKEISMTADKLIIALKGSMFKQIMTKKIG